MPTTSCLPCHLRCETARTMPIRTGQPGNKWKTWPCRSRKLLRARLRDSGYQSYCPKKHWLTTNDGRSFLSSRSAQLMGMSGAPERRPNMARLNILKLGHLASTLRTHEGAPARRISPELQLRRSVLACLLWESQFYEDGVAIAGRIAELVPKVEAERVASLAVEAREAMKLRHAPLLLVREMARHKTHRTLVAETLARVIQRADELAEFMAIYWQNGRAPLSAQVKKGLAAAFTKFDEYALAKYDRAGSVKLRDVLFLCHAKPRDEAQATLWKRLIAGELTPPDAWEVALSSGAHKCEAWERLLAERKLGALALLRNLRNMKDAGVREELVLEALRGMKTDRVLPFRFLAAARYAPQWEEALEQAMFRSLAGREKLAGRTVLLIDTSGSMDAP